MNVVAILQARMHSTRLPGKMLLPLLDKPLVQHVIERVQRATKLDEVVLAIPGGVEFLPIIKATGVSPYVASSIAENDLVSRYLGAAQYYGADLIVRIPCDNPCVDPVYIDSAVENYLDNATPFYSNASSVWIGDKRIDGAGCEVLSLSRLKWLDRITQGKQDEREHLHKYFHDREIGVWKTYRDSALRLDVNTQSEYEFVASIFTHFGHNRFTTQDVVNYLTTKEAPHEVTQRR